MNDNRTDNAIAILARTTRGWKDGCGVKTSLPEGRYTIKAQRVEAGTRYFLLDGLAWVRALDVRVVVAGF